MRVCEAIAGRDACEDGKWAWSTVQGRKREIKRKSTRGWSAFSDEDSRREMKVGVYNKEMLSTVVKTKKKEKEGQGRKGNVSQLN